MSIALSFAPVVALLLVSNALASTHNQQGLPTSAVAAPAAPPSADESKDRLTERYTAGLEATTGALEKVIAAQSNQINVFTVMAAILGLLLTAAGLGLFRSVQKTVRDAVDDRVADLLSQRIDESNARSTKLHEVFIRTVAETAKDLVAGRQSELLAQVRAGKLDLSDADGVRKLINLQSDVLLGPMQSVATMFTLAAGQKTGSDLHEACWVLYAEVAAENVTPRAMLQLVVALTNVLRHRNVEPVVMEDLRKFADQLRESVASGELPKAPNF